jgi:hypothetical protein
MVRLILFFIHVSFNVGLSFYRSHIPKDRNNLCSIYLCLPTRMEHKLYQRTGIIYVPSVSVGIRIRGKFRYPNWIIGLLILRHVRRSVKLVTKLSMSSIRSVLWHVRLCLKMAVCDS